MTYESSQQVLYVGSNRSGPALRIGRNSLWRWEDGQWQLAQPAVGEKPLWTCGGAESVLLALTARFEHVAGRQARLLGLSSEDHWFRYFADGELSNLLIAAGHINPWPLLFWLNDVGEAGRKLYEQVPVLAVGLSASWYATRVGEENGQRGEKLSLRPGRASLTWPEAKTYAVSHPIEACDVLGFNPEVLPVLEKINTPYQLEWRYLSALKGLLQQPELVQGLKQLPRVDGNATKFLCYVPPALLTKELISALPSILPEQLHAASTIARLWEICPNSHPRTAVRTVEELLQLQQDLVDEHERREAGLEGHPLPGGTVDHVEIIPVRRFAELSKLYRSYTGGQTRNTTSITAERLNNWKDCFLPLAVPSRRTWVYAVKRINDTFGAAGLVGYLFVSADRIESHLGARSRALPRDVHRAVRHWWRRAVTMAGPE